MAEFNITAKDESYLESFVDPGVPYEPATGPPDVWFRRVIEEAAELVIAFASDGTVTYVSDSTQWLMGYEPGSLLGTNALDLIHPDDLANAAETVYHAARVEGWRPPRPFRLRLADGSYLTFDVEGLALFHVPEVRSIVCIARPADHLARVDTILGLLAAQKPIADILDQVVHLMSRPGWQIGVVIQYDAGGGERAVTHTGLPDALWDLDPENTAAPWARARETGKAAHDLGLHTVGPAATEAGAARGFQTCSAFPAADAEGYEDACVIVWNAELVEPELGQELLLQRLCNLLELALAGRARAAALERAANTDALTGLANRRAFEALLEGVAGDRAGHGGGAAVVIADLDGFKDVNDRLGHAAGDLVIRVCGQRIAAAVREGDVPARLGGDEFAVFCRGPVDDEQLAAIASRIVASVSRPIRLDDDEASVGVSVGIAATSDRASADAIELLRLADEQLYAAKGAGKGQYRLARLDPG